MSDSVAKQTSAVASMVAACAKGRALMGGTDAMRAAGELYLPRFDAEPLETYQSRLKRSVLFEAFPDTVRSMTGMVFSKPVELVEAPSAMADWVDNIDMQGRDLSVFAADVFEDGFLAGVSFIMADAPRRGSEMTRAQAEASGMRPYLVHLRVEDVLGWKTELFGNTLAFSQFRIMEIVKEPDPEDEFSEIEVEQVRVLDRDEAGVSVRIFRKPKEDWIVYDEYATDAKEITVVPYYARRTGFGTGKPPLQGLTDLNIGHWNLQSSMYNNAHYALIPVMMLAGFDEESEMVLSSNIAFKSGNHEAKAEWVKTDTGAIETTKGLLAGIEEQMQTMGLQLLAEKVKSATGEERDAAKETSNLAMMADNLKDALEQALAWMSDYGGLGEQAVTVEVNKNFGLKPMTHAEMSVLQKDVVMGLLSKETYTEERKRSGFLRPDLDTEDEMERIEAEGGPDLMDDQDGGE